MVRNNYALEIHQGKCLVLTNDLITNAISYMDIE